MFNIIRERKKVRLECLCPSRKPSQTPQIVLLVVSGPVLHTVSSLLSLSDFLLNLKNI